MLCRKAVTQQCLSWVSYPELTFSQRLQMRPALLVAPYAVQRGQADLLYPSTRGK